MENKIIEILRGKQNIIDVHWYVTDWCNYKCPYCNPSGQAHAWVPYETIIKTAINLNKLIESIDKPVNLFLVGGEVTYYDLKDLLEKYLIAKNLVKFSFITNLSRNLDYFLELKDYCTKRGISLGVRASAHPTQIPDMDEFLHKAEVLKSAINIVLNHSNHRQVMEFLQNIKENQLQIRAVDILFDRNETIRSSEVMEVYNYYLNNISKKENCFHLITYENGDTSAFNRAQVASLNYDFRDYNCTGILRIFTDGRLTSGACSSHSMVSYNINDLSDTDLKNIGEFVTVKCKNVKCPLCTFKRIWKE